MQVWFKKRLKYLADKIKTGFEVLTSGGRVINNADLTAIVQLIVMDLIKS